MREYNRLKVLASYLHTKMLGSVGLTVKSIVVCVDVMRMGKVEELVWRNINLIDQKAIFLAFSVRHIFILRNEPQSLLNISFPAEFAELQRFLVPFQTRAANDGGDGKTHNNVLRF